MSYTCGMIYREGMEPIMLTDEEMEQIAKDKRIDDEVEWIRYVFSEDGLWDDPDHYDVDAVAKLMDSDRFCRKIAKKLIEESTAEVALCGIDRNITYKLLDKAFLPFIVR